MNILVVGCGKIGSSVTKHLFSQGHDVSIIAERLEQLENLDTFIGLTVVGVPIDQDILVQAGIENCDSLIALTQSDNMNLMVSQMAQKIYHIKNVVVRMNDDSRKEYYEKLGIKTICTTTLVVNGIIDLLY